MLVRDARVVFFPFPSSLEQGSKHLGNKIIKQCTCPISSASQGNTHIRGQIPSAVRILEANAFPTARVWRGLGDAAVIQGHRLHLVVRHNHQLGFLDR